MAICAICKFEAIDLSKHIKNAHGMFPEEYGNKFQVRMIDISVDEKRKQTCLDKYGDANYRNREAQALSFEVYEGGHPFRDPAVRLKAEETKQNLYGDSNYTNRDKSEKTCMAKYGVKHVTQVEAFRKKSVQTSISRYGKAINYTYVPPFSKDDLIDLHVKQRKSLSEMGILYNLTPEGMSYWMKKFEVPVTKRISIPSIKEFISTKNLVTDFFNACVENNKILSFYDYGKIKGQKNMLKMKRAFNTGRLYNQLREELFQIALNPEKWPEFLQKFS